MDRTRRWRWPSLLALATPIWMVGCGQVIMLPAPGTHLQSVCDRITRPDLSPTTLTLLADLGLVESAESWPLETFALLERRICAARPDAQRLLALAELADQISRTREGMAAGGALAWSRDAAVYAGFCLSSAREKDAEYGTAHTATVLHNRAVVRCLRLAGSRQPATSSNWATALTQSGIALSSPEPTWTALGLDSLEPTSDFAQVGQRLPGHRTGLGVPVIAQRRLEHCELAMWKPYGPRRVTFAATAIIQSPESIATWRQKPVELVLHDPLHEEVLDQASLPQPMASDLTIPLIRRLSQRPIRQYEYLGVLDPEFYTAHAGVYAIDPYQPGKIPVVLIHGIWSSPTVWVPMLATLRGDPRLRSAYQFWVVLYPSGHPLPLAACSLRRSLREIRQRFDPEGTDRALDQMVILGKSTGGQATKMLVEPSGDALWNAVFTRPLDQIRTSATLRAELQNIFYFEPEAYVRRIIFLTTSHRGSRLGTQPGVRLGIRLIRQSNPLRPIWSELESTNGLNVFQPWFRERPLSSADGLEMENPVLMALDGQQIANGVVYHSIIANLNHARSLEKISDGFVDYQSAHLDGAASERIVTAGHVCEADSEVIDEVRRILYVHLAELDHIIATINP